MLGETGLRLVMLHGTAATWLILLCLSFCSLWAWPLHLLSRFVLHFYWKSLGANWCANNMILLYWESLYADSYMQYFCSFNFVVFLSSLSCREYQTGLTLLRRWFLELWNFSFGVSCYKVSFYLILTTLPSFCCLMNLKVKSNLVLTCLGFKPVYIYGTYNKTFHQFKEHSCFFVGNDRLFDEIMVSLSHFFKKFWIGNGAWLRIAVYVVKCELGGGSLFASLYFG